MAFCLDLDSMLTFLVVQELAVPTRTQANTLILQMRKWKVKGLDQDDIAS